MKAEAFTQAFLKNSLSQMKDAAIEEMMLHKAVVLEYKRPKRGKKRKAKGLNAKERRRLKLFQLKPEHQKSVLEVLLYVYILFHLTVLYHALYYISKTSAYH